MFLQLNPQIPVRVAENPDGIPEGPGTAFAWLDYGVEYHVLWGIAFDNAGVIWWVPNPLVRFRTNPSTGRTP